MNKSRYKKYKIPEILASTKIAEKVTGIKAEHGNSIMVTTNENMITTINKTQIFLELAKALCNLEITFFKKGFVTVSQFGPNFLNL